MYKAGRLCETRRFQHLRHIIILHVTVNASASTFGLLLMARRFSPLKRRTLIDEIPLAVRIGLYGGGGGETADVRHRHADHVVNQVLMQSLSQCAGCTDEIIEMIKVRAFGTRHQP